MEQEELDELDKDVSRLYEKVDALESLVLALIDTMSAGFSTDGEIKDLLKQDRELYFHDINKK